MLIELCSLGPGFLFGLSRPTCARILWGRILRAPPLLVTPTIQKGARAPMSPVQYDVVFYPKTGLHEHKKILEVRDVMTEFRQALTRYLVQEEKLCQPHDVGDIGLVSAASKILEARTF